MKQQATLIVLGLLVVLSQYTSASTQVPMDRTITQLITYDNLIVLRFDPPYPNDQNCLSAVQDRAVAIKLEPDGTGTYVKNNNLYASALAAYLSRRKVGFGINGGCANWSNGIPYIYRVEIAP